MAELKRQRDSLGLITTFVSLVIVSALGYGKPIIVKLISKVNYKIQKNHLVKCKLRPVKLEKSKIKTTTLDFKTVVKTVTAGNCNTQFPISVKFTPNRDKKKSVFKVSAMKAQIDEHKMNNKRPIGDFTVVNNSTR